MRGNLLLNIQHMLCTRMDSMLSGSSKAGHMQSCLSWLADPSDGCHASIYLEVLQHS